MGTVPRRPSARQVFRLDALDHGGLSPLIAISIIDPPVQLNPGGYHAKAIDIVSYRKNPIGTPSYQYESFTNPRSQFTIETLDMGFHSMSDRQSGQLDEWLLLNHLYKQLAWKRFLQVLQGFCGRLLSMTLIIE